MNRSLCCEFRLLDREQRIAEIGDDLEGAVQAALEEAGFSPKAADDFIENCVFNAWAGWDYEPGIVA